MTTSIDLLNRCIDIQKERGEQYEGKEGKERSIAKMVKMFNALYDTEMTEQQGWAFMCMLKLVRLETCLKSQNTVHTDSVEDLVSYIALYGESVIDNHSEYSVSTDTPVEPVHTSTPPVTVSSLLQEFKFHQQALITVKNHLTALMNNPITPEEDADMVLKALTDKSMFKTNEGINSNDGETN